jgi:parvulin-like peptidyl-prolyl isomerase
MDLFILRRYNAVRVKSRLLLLFLVVPALLAAGCGGGGAAQTSDDDIATVGSLHIGKARFVDEMNRARVRLKAQKQPFPKQGTTEYEQLKAQAIWLLVLEKARELEANKLGIDVTDQQVTERITSIKKDQFGGSEAKFQKELKKEGLTEAETRAIVRDLLVSQALTTHITEDVKVSDGAVKKYYDEHKADYPPTREVQYILVGKDKKETTADLVAQKKDPKKDKDAAKQVAAAYDDPEKVANDIYNQLKKGAKFAALAKKYSHDDTTKNTGGKLTAKKAELVPKFGDVAFEMKTGSVEKFETPEYGWFVVKANGPVKETTQKDVAETIRQTLLQEDQNDAITEWASNLAKKICTDGKIEYQIGYTPNPDPCAQYTAPTTTTG